MDDYDKLPLEAAARRAAAPHTILRLPMIYGPGDRQQRFRWVLSPMLAGRPRLTLDPAWGGWRTTYGFIDDVADAIAHAATQVRTVNRTFNLGESETPVHAEWAQRFAHTLGWRGAVERRPASPNSARGTRIADRPP